MKKELYCNKYLAAVICLGLILCCVPAYAQQEESDDIETARLENQGTLHSKSDVVSGPFEVSLNIDTEPCKT